MDCLSLPELELSDWGESLLSQLHGQRYPLGGIFELTERCNFSCLHCYINQPAANRAAQARELTTNQVKGVLDQMADAGCLFLTLTGGEVLLRADFAEIYTHVRQCGMLVSIFTNGTLLTPRIADLLADLRPLSIEITLYGATPETYEAVTQVSGSYARCRRGIDLLLERHLPLSLKAFLLTVNHHELPEMKTLARELGVKFRYDGMIFPRLDGNRLPLDYQLPLQVMVALDTEDPERKQEWEKAFDQVSGHTGRGEYVFSCGAGLRSFHVDSACQMSICTMARRPGFDLLKMTFQEGWERLGELRNTRRQLDTPCSTCTISELCSQCPGWSQAVHGDDVTPVDSVCQLAHARYEQLQHIRL